MKLGMKLTQSLAAAYSKERKTAMEAQHFAQEIAFAPIVFQVSRLMVKFGILDYMAKNPDGVSRAEIVEHTGLTDYAIQVLLEASFSIGTVLTNNDKYNISKAGWFLINDPMVKVNMDYNHDVNYQGMFYLEDALLEGKPAGLKVFGDWSTIYEGISSLPAQAQKSWLAFDHFYSDKSFAGALKIIFDENHNVHRLLDVGGNTGRWAMQCVNYSEKVDVTILDLPQQLAMMRQYTAGKPGADRIHAYACNLLDDNSKFPAPVFDVIWMSQFLDCFSESEITTICRKATEAMDNHSRLYIMETFWNRQKYETAAYCLTLTSVYFTAMANGNSKMYHSDDMERCVNNAGLKVERIIDGLGLGHSIMICKKQDE